MTLSTAELPAHTHNVVCSTSQGATNISAGSQLATAQVGTARASTSVPTYSTAAPNSMFAPQSLAPAGGGGAHNNMMPYLTLAFCICLSGIFPQRP